MKLRRFLILIGFLLTHIFFSSQAFPKDGKLPSEFLSYEGRLFIGFQDPDFITYDLSLRNYLTQRLKKEFGVELDPKGYSSFDLLEIVSLMKCKKKEESLDNILKFFPRFKPTY
ncbi:MAG: hypothetical protein ACUVTN_05680 [Thermodesulfobacteriota bacterium]